MRVKRAHGTRYESRGLIVPAYMRVVPSGIRHLVHRLIG